MVGNSPRRFPIRLDPVDGESFPSYIERLASRMSMTPLGLLRAVGVCTRTGRPPAFGLSLSADAATALQTATGLACDQLLKMQLAAYDGLAFEMSGVGFHLSDPSTVRRFVTSAWVYAYSSHACPRCLRETGGAWQLRWKLPWLFACMRHSCLLMNRCPSCNTRFSQHVLARDRKPSECTLCLANAGKHIASCRRDLATVEAVEIADRKEILEAERRLEAALSGANADVAGATVTPIDYFGTMRTLCALILKTARPDDFNVGPAECHEAFQRHCAERDRRSEIRQSMRERGESTRTAQRTASYVKVPEDAALMAAVAPASVEILQAKTGRELSARIHWLCERIREVRPKYLRRALTSYPLCRPVALGIEDNLNRHGRFSVRHHFGGASPVGELRSYSADAIPQLIPMPLFDRMFGRLFSTRAPSRRLFCAMALVKRAEKLTWKQAGQALGHHAGASAQELGVADLRALGTEDAFGQTIEELAEQLERSASTDFGARRRALSRFELIPPSASAALCDSAGARTRSTHRRRWGAVWVWTLITCADYRTAPGFCNSSNPRRVSEYGRFVRDELPALRSELEILGAALLPSTHPCSRLAGEFLGYVDETPSSPADTWRTVFIARRGRLDATE